MAINRRKFVKLSALSGAGLLVGPHYAFSRKSSSILFSVNSFIQNNPDAVFIMRTNISDKTDSDAKRTAGFDFGQSVFNLTDDVETGIPISHKMVIKPNLTYVNYDGHSSEEGMGIITDVHFVEGVIESLKVMGIEGNNCYIREVWNENEDNAGYQAMAERTGIDYKRESIPALELDSSKVVWKDVQNGVWFKKIPYIWPVNAPESFLINISKLKAHGMGMTLCAKNLQGTIAMDYQAHCTSFRDTMSGVDPAHLNPAANNEIYNNYNRHVNEGIPRWDRPGTRGGIWQETWASRCLDNNSTTLAGLHIIEGIIGRDGNWFDGPGGSATDYMTNYIIFGLNQFYVDNIGHYLAGHEPGNFGLFHLAMERGFTNTINPSEIPLYEWNPQEGASNAVLSDFERYELKTYYLQRDYDDQTEEKWHLVNEPYNYTPTSVPVTGAELNGFTLHQNYPNPVKTLTTIPFDLPSDGKVKIEIFNQSGRLVRELVDEKFNTGQHSITWNAVDEPSGSYFCRIRYKDVVKVGKMLVLH